MKHAEHHVSQLDCPCAFSKLGFMLYWHPLCPWHPKPGVPYDYLARILRGERW